jgi:hypothetical protein
MDSFIKDFILVGGFLFIINQDDVAMNIFVNRTNNNGINHFHWNGG